jgi:K+-sensing histidine kinase KdpD
MVGAAFVLAGVVGLVDALSSAYIAFSIFYLTPIFLATWFGNRTAAISVAVACGLIGVVADLWTFDSLGVSPWFAATNLALRLTLFVLMAIVLSQLHAAMGREKEVSEREHEAAERLQELNELKGQLMRSVAVDAREPLGDIYARVVTLGFDMPKMSMVESREVLNEIADASRRLSGLVNTLLDEERPAPAVPEPAADAAS